MNEKTVLSPYQEKVLAVVGKNPNGLLVKEIANKTVISRSSALISVNILESQCLLETRRIGKNRIVFLYGKAPVEELAKEKKEFALDELEIRILRAEGKTYQEIAKELGILPMEVGARIERSIPIKLGVSFEEARKKFKKEAVES